MESDLEKRFKYLQTEIQEDLAEESQASPAPPPEPRVVREKKERNQRVRKLAKEVFWFLGALAVGYGLGFLIREFLVDQILEPAFVQSEDWGKPPDEKTVDLVIHQEFWRTHGLIHLYALVCLLGCYLTRATIWAIKNRLPEFFREEQQGA